MKYLIKDENGDLMRVVGRQEEARQLVQVRNGWSFIGVRSPKVRLDLSQFEDALI